jgi:sortase (surface protein transpeptidase)
VIAGHVDSRRFGIGVFAELWKVRPGAVVDVRNGALHARYKVVSRTEVPQARMTRDTGAFRQDVSHRLVLITCGGPFDRTRHRYRDNIVLIARPVI